jgi:glycosyltransferase involved in cell wall biosynthesis
MRILHVYSGNLFGGIEAILVAIARAHAPRGGTVHEFALCFEGRLSAALRTAGARVHMLPSVRMSRPHTARAARQALARVIATGSFDRMVCHAPWSQAIFGGIARRAGVPLVFWAHDAAAGRHWTERLARRSAPDLVVANSRFTLRTIDRLFPGVPGTVVYAPIDVPSHGIDPRERFERRAGLDTPDDAVVIVQASRSQAWKGHLLLVEALAELRDVPRWIWWQVGGAQRPAEEDVLRQVRAAAARAGIADRVRWLGQRDDVPAVLASADVYCQANLRAEPFGVVFVEALAAGLPVVTTNAGGACEIVTDACGVLVEADAHAFAAALRRVISDSDERARMARAGPPRARALCDPRQQVERLNAALAQMAETGAHA